MTRGAGRQVDIRGVSSIMYPRKAMTIFAFRLPALELGLAFFDGRYP